MIKDLNVRPDTVKSLEEQVDAPLGSLTLAFTMIFWGLTTRTKVTKAKINEWASIKSKSFCTTKESNKKKRQPMEWENVRASRVSDKG